MLTRCHCPTANNAPTVYAFSLSIQIVFPFLVALPRFIFPVVATAIYLPIAIVGATRFAALLSNFLGILGYWSSIFAAVLITEVSRNRLGRTRRASATLEPRSVARKQLEAVPGRISSP